MTSLTIIAIALAAVATGLVIASVILAGRQSTERRPGFITDQLGASPARAHTPAPVFGGRSVRMPLIREGVGLHGEAIRSTLPGDDAALPPLDASDPRFASGLEVRELPLHGGDAA